MSVLPLLLLNLTLLVTLSFLCAMAFTQEHRTARPFLHSGLGLLSSLLLMAFPGQTLAGDSVDLRFVPVALVMLGFGPRYAAPMVASLMVVGAVYGDSWTAPGVVGGLLTLGVCWLLWGGRRSLRWQPWELICFAVAASLPALNLQERSLASGFWVLLAGNLLGFVVAYWVLSSRLRLIKLTWNLRDLAHTDPLTALSNRRQYERDLRLLPVGGHLLLLDLDHFKGVNDRHGHATGDEALIVIGAVLGVFQTEQVQVYRIGGEEFALLLQTGSAAVAEKIATLLLERVREARVLLPGSPDEPGEDDQGASGRPEERVGAERSTLRLTCSLGLAQLDGDQDHVGMFRRADEALHQSKQGGRDRLTVATSSGRPEPVDLQAQNAVTPAGRIQVTASQGGGHALWNALLDTLHDLGLDRDLSRDDHQRLLDSAVLAIPGAGAGTLSLLERGRFVVVAQSGFGDPMVGRSLTVSGQRDWYAGRNEDLLRGVPRLLTDRAIAQVDDTSLMLSTSAGVLANICVPVVLGTQVAAYLNLDNLERSDAFGSESLELAGVFGRLLSASLTAQKRRTERLVLEQSLSEVQGLAAQLQQVTSAQAALEILVQQLHAVLWADSVCLYSVSALGLDLLASAGTVSPPQTNLLPGEGLCWSSVERQQFLNLPAVRADVPGFSETLSGPHTLLLLPLQSPLSPEQLGGGEVWGLLAVVRPVARPFLEIDEACCARFANLTERALHRLEREHWEARARLSGRAP